MIVDKINVGVLGCGQIAQAGHLESCSKARNANLYAVCDSADDLRSRMKIFHGASKSFSDYDDMLSDNNIDAVIIATADAFHVPMSIKALQAGKHVLCEKPLTNSLDEALRLSKVVEQSGKIFQVGHMKRYDHGLQKAKAFIIDEMGDMLALKAWYCDSSHRYQMTNAVQPLIIKSDKSIRPEFDPKKELKSYYILAHGSHLLDTARYFGGEILSLKTRLSVKKGIYCWFTDVTFKSGTIGHLDLTIAVRLDWHEGFQIYGENGSIVGKTYNPWFFKSSEVDIFREKDGSYQRPLGADGHFYRRQLEGFADNIINGNYSSGATIRDGVACVRAMLAISQSVKCNREILLSEVSGEL